MARSAENILKRRLLDEDLDNRRSCWNVPGVGRAGRVSRDDRQ